MCTLLPAVPLLMHLLAGWLQSLLRAGTASPLEHGGRRWPSEPVGQPALGREGQAVSPSPTAEECGLAAALPHRADVHNEAF